MIRFNSLTPLALFAMTGIFAVAGCGDGSESTTTATPRTTTTTTTTTTTATAPTTPIATTGQAASSLAATAPSEPKDPLPKSLPMADLAKLQSLARETAQQNRILVVDFWATWCPPCVAQFADMHEGLVAMGDDKVRPVTVTLDSPGKLEQKAIEFLVKHHALKDAYIAPADTDAQIEIIDGIGDQWNQIVVPAVFVYNKQGEIVGQYFNGPDDLPALLKQVKELTGS